MTSAALEGPRAPRPGRMIELTPAPLEDGCTCYPDPELVCSSLAGSCACYSAEEGKEEGKKEHCNSKIAGQGMPAPPQTGFTLQLGAEPAYSQLMSTRAVAELYACSLDPPAATVSQSSGFPGSRLPPTLQQQSTALTVLCEDWVQGAGPQWSHGAEAWGLPEPSFVWGLSGASYTLLCSPWLGKGWGTVSNSGRSSRQDQHW